MVSRKSFQFNLIFVEENLREGYLENILGKYVVQPLKGLLEVFLIERRERWEEAKLGQYSNLHHKKKGENNTCDNIFIEEKVNCGSPELALKMRVDCHHDVRNLHLLRLDEPAIFGWHNVSCSRAGVESFDFSIYFLTKSISWCFHLNCCTPQEICAKFGKTICWQYWALWLWWFL